MDCGDERPLIVVRCVVSDEGLTGLLCDVNKFAESKRTSFWRHIIYSTNSVPENRTIKYTIEEYHG
jgi:hypothetical protein